MTDIPLMIYRSVRQKDVADDVNNMMVVIATETANSEQQNQIQT